MSGRNSLIAGLVNPGFEAVREAFIENFTMRRELGAACCIYFKGEKVVDLWGGVRNKATGEPWEENTMVGVFSTAKGMAGLAMALAHSRGLLDYEERVCTYGPEFAQQAKARITVRQLPIPPVHGFYDEVMKKEMTLSLGFLKPCRTYPFGHPSAFGEPGAGGSFGFADPEAGIGYAYVTNQMGAKLGGDPRDLALRDALRRSIGQPT